MFSGIGGTEIIVLFLVILIFFGSDKIPELARGIGQGMNEFKKASNSLKDEIEKGKQNFQSSPPKKEEVSKSTKEKVVEDKQEKSTEN